MGTLQILTRQDVGDDNKMLAGVLYSAVKDAQRVTENQQETTYEDKLRKTLKYSLENTANDTLAYKLKKRDCGSSEQDIDELANFILEKFPLIKVRGIYQEAVSINKNKKGQAIVNKFREIFSRNGDFSEALDGFWTKTEELLNSSVEKFREELKGMAHFDENDPNRFIVQLGEEHLDATVTKLILSSENDSLEYLLENISFVFRGDDYIFEADTEDRFTVMVKDGVCIKNLHLVDTQGLFNSTNNVADEVNRLTDLLNGYHSADLIYCINSNTTATTKQSNEALRNFLQNINGVFYVHLVFTHFDECLKKVGGETRTDGTSKYGRRRVSVNWNDAYAKATHEQDVLVESFKQALESQTSKKHPNIVGGYRTAIINDDGRMEDCLDENECLYPDAWIKIIGNILAEQRAQGSKVRLFNNDLSKCIGITLPTTTLNCKVLFENLIECKSTTRDDKGLYASTVRACVNKFRYYGVEHISNVQPNVWNFCNISTIFVREIRNLAVSQLSNVTINVINEVSTPEDAQRFSDGLISFLKERQEFGREVAKTIAEDSYINGFKFNPKPWYIYYQYHYFGNMLEYIQKNYFNSTQITISPKLADAINTALKICVQRYVDYHCITVY